VVAQLTVMSSRAADPERRRDESHWSAFDAAGIQRLLAAEDRHFWFRARNETLAALALGPIGRLPDGFHILEVGCGSGNVLRVLQRLAAGRGEVEGLELSVEAAKVARDRTGLRVTNGYLSDLDSSTSYDVVAAFDVLEHIADEAEVLTQMRERMPPDGCLILTVPAHQALWSPFDIASGHYRRYSMETLSRALRSSGYRVEYITYFMSLLFPPMWLRRRFLKTEHHDMGELLDSEFQIIPGINVLAYELLRCEAQVVSRRWRLPFGTSLAAIARPHPSA
jgi:2-polyprenyl-3-methyl-5-hydroxy-6-metoxy-1,4-benzoquinol methylase